MWTFLGISWPYLAFVLFWKKFITSWELLQLGGWFIFLNILISINFNVLAWLWKVKERVKIIWIAALWNLIWNFIAVKFIWLKGVILTTIIWWFLMVILSYKEIINTWINIKFDLNFLVKNIVWLLFLWFLLKLYISNLDFNLGRGYIFLNLLIAWIIFSVFILILNIKEFIAFLNEVRKVLRSN